jgi:uncharacterized protein
MRIGIISDTHDLLRAEVFDLFSGVDHILHGGDVGGAGVLVELRSIAPLTAVVGNTDGSVRGELSELARVDLDGIRCLVVHGHQVGSPTPERLMALYPDVDLLVFGHTHKPLIQKVGTVLAVNPGSAGPVRFGVAPTVAIAERHGDVLQARLFEIDAATEA